VRNVTESPWIYFLENEEFCKLHGLAKSFSHSARRNEIQIVAWDSVK
jgi:hypothetical protein